MKIRRARESLARLSARRLWGLVALLVVLGFLPYANALMFDFVWDDRALILESPYVRDARLLPDGLFADYWTHPDRPGHRRSFYRPLMTLSFFVDYALWGESPAGYHANNLLLHIINVLLVYSCFSVLASRELALVAAALFAVHPVHTESVTWISGRTDLLASLLVLGAFRSYLSVKNLGRYGAFRVAAVGFLYLLAVLAKEVAIMLPLVMASHGLLFRSSDEKVRTFRKACLWSSLGVAGVYVILRTQVLQIPLFVDHDRPFALLVFNLPRIVARYLLKLVAPLRLHAHDPLDWVYRDQWLAVVAASASLLVALLAVIWVGNRDRKSWLGAIWLGAFLAPVLNAGTFTDVLVAERFLYLPSVGFCWILASVYGLARGVEGWHRTVWLATWVLIVAAGARTWYRNPVWRDDIVFFEAIHRTSPHFALPHRALASAYLRHGMPEKAIQELEHVLSQAPRDCAALNTLALAYFDLGMARRSGPTLDAGFALTQRAVQACPESDTLHHTLGEYFLRMKNLEKNVERGLAQFQKAIALNPSRSQYYFEVGSILIELGRKEEAVPYLAEYVRIAPDGERRQQALQWLRS